MLALIKLSGFTPPDQAICQNVKVKYRKFHILFFSTNTPNGLWEELHLMHFLPFYTYGLFQLVSFINVWKVHYVFSVVTGWTF